MKKLVLLLSILLYTTAAYSQGYYMNGRFSNTTPDLSLGIDSAAFNFTNTNYTYFINDNPDPSSFGTYYVVTGGPSDTLVLTEDNLGACSFNGTGTTVMLELDKTFTPFQSLIISETTQSQDSCPSTSAKMSGDFISTGGTIITVTSVKNTNTASTLKADVYMDELRLTSLHNEKASITVANINGQSIIKTQHIPLQKGQQTAIPLQALISGIYFIRIQTEHELKVVKFAR